MFGKRTTFGGNTPGAAPAPRPAPIPAPAVAARVEQAVRTPEPARRGNDEIIDVRSPEAAARDKDYFQTKSAIFNALIDSIDLSQLATMEQEAAREEIRDIVAEIIALKSIVMSISEQEDLLEDICNDVLGYGPLEPLLARDDIADIMVNGSQKCYIEVGGKVKLTNVRFRDDSHLMNVCQRIVSQVGRRVDESSPICDARLPDGSRVNVIAPPLSIDGAALTIRKFKKDKLTLQQLVKYASISPEGAEVLRILGRVRANVLISGGTGSGKTTLLNCLTAFIERDERVITCEDSAELQLQQPHVVRLETRPPNLEGEGEITMRDLVKNCLRMRPERIIVGEVRGPEAFDLLQAMNTGHDGSMGTLHANSPREALSRLESMITMGGYSLPSRTIREMITSSIDVIVQAARLRDGSRRITHISEVLGMEGDVIVTQDIFVYDILGEDSNGQLIGRHRSTGITKPNFSERARYFNEEANLVEALERSNVEQHALLET
ncbi:CpaF family protein [Paradevosia shaoguanensis]|uniref:CpaF family protein n=1 Tax=Paradevosia shaoguanensis TaxID=1335043 RepID=A0AA41QPZ6_9HYPH|nr:CpaF family protein [Paradevosia shaoguanensis]KFL26551.1 protein kinase [Devosia sp. 17-2-E-8]MCF1744072.1 CpaF family protein [Paradevosia shaoguanensis]MCI0128555.1 CpaF family protein [Paradevosia shaoguanensis]CDP50625.1 Type II/IV secretion system ATP hydrolase TadA/Vir B11/CpaF, TadA subfamily [Devosia sp. DBB001]